MKQISCPSVQQERNLLRHYDCASSCNETFSFFICSGQEKLTCNAATMTEASTQLVHRSVQTEKTTTEESSVEKGCTFCGRRKQGLPASEIPERDTDYTIFFPEKSPHLAQKLSQKPGPRTAPNLTHRLVQLILCSKL